MKTIHGFAVGFLLASGALWAASAPIYLPNLLKNGTGTTSGGHNGLDVQVIGALPAASPSVSPIHEVGAPWVVSSPTPGVTPAVAVSPVAGTSQTVMVTNAPYVVSSPAPGVTPVVAASPMAAALFPVVMPTPTVTIVPSGTQNVAVTNAPFVVASPTPGVTPTVAASPMAGATFPSVQSGTWTVQPGNTANTTAWKVDGSAVTQPGSMTGANAPFNPSGTTTQSTAIGSGAVVTLTKATNSVASICQASSSNTVNLRLGIGTDPTTTLGIRLEPGRSEFFPIGANVRAIAESGSNQELNCQWVVNQ